VKKSDEVPDKGMSYTRVRDKTETLICRRLELLSATKMKGSTRTVAAHRELGYVVTEAGRRHIMSFAMPRTDMD
jgi:hypothetical protein